MQNNSFKKISNKNTTPTGVLAYIGNTVQTQIRSPHPDSFILVSSTNTLSPTPYIQYSERGFSFFFVWDTVGS